MNKIGAIETGAAGAIVVLSVFPNQEDHASLRNLLSYSDWPLCPGFRWALKSSTSLDEAMPILLSERIAVVLCECDLRQGTWRDMVSALMLLPDPPYLIVTSRQADERLWAEALNLGAHDVLATPFDRAEAIRTLSVAWLRWSDRHRPAISRAAKSAA